MKRLAKKLAVLPFRILPASVRHALVRAVGEATVDQAPATALRRLLQIDSMLSALIDQAAIRYDNGIHVKHRLMKYHDFFVDRVRPGERVLDVGCGYGAVAHSVASRAGAAVVGVDFEPANVAKARALFVHPALSFVEGTVPQDVPPGGFDVVIASNVLEHIEDRLGWLAETQRRAAPGRWLIRVPMSDRDWRVPLRQELGLDSFSDPTHFTEYTRESFEREMAAAGLVVTHLQINWGEIWAEAHAT